MDDSYDPLKRDKSSKRKKEVTMKDPFTVMFVGTDVRSAKSENWRSDVLIVAAVNPKEKSIKMVSIPRDTLAPIANTQGKDKINSAASYGISKNVGPMTNTVETVEHFLNIPIDYYVKVNFNGFIELVDAVGGVDVNVPFDFSMRLFYKMQHYEKGPAHLDGTRALGYVRMRKSDPRGDQGRNERQREVIQALMSKIVDIKSVTKIDDILQSLGRNVTHNMKLEELYELQDIYRAIPDENTETLKLNGRNSKDNPKGIWYYIVTDQERLRLSNVIRKQLKLPLQTLDGKPYQPTESQNQEEQGMEQQETGTQTPTDPAQGNQGMTPQGNQP